ncbi:MAG TPA: NUDIX hydrolase [Candidatus Saccharimonadales bacterium]
MKLNFCMECGAPLNKQTDTEYVCDNGHTFWNNPRATTDVVSLNSDNQVLFSKRAREPAKGMYNLPGGFCEYGESAKQTAVREIKEETGLDIAENNLGLIFACPGPYNENEWLITTVYLVRRWSGEIASADDSLELSWKDITFFDDPTCVDVYKGLRGVVESKL